MHNWPQHYDIIKVNGMIPDWVDDYETAYFGSSDDYYKIDLRDENILIQFFTLTEITT